MDYQEHIAADRRLVILKLLEESSGYLCNEYLLRQMLEAFGHTPSQNMLRDDFVWLDMQGLVTVSETGGLFLAKLTARGLDVADGREVVDGVKRPSPGE